MQRHFAQLMSTNGNGGGQTNMIGDYSESPTVFYVKPQNGPMVYEIKRIIVTLRDEAIEIENYGSGVSLSNGIILRHTRAGEVICDYTAGQAVKMVADYSRFACHAARNPAGETQDQFIARLNFECFGMPLRLFGGRDDRLELVCRDSLVHLEEHIAQVEGIAIDT